MNKWTKAIAAVAAGAMLIPLAACGSSRGGGQLRRIRGFI